MSSLAPAMLDRSSPLLEPGQDETARVSELVHRGAHSFASDPRVFPTAVRDRVGAVGGGVTDDDGAHDEFAVRAKRESMSLVKMPAWSPKRDSFTRLKASSMSSYVATTTTGPKASSHQTRAS